MRAIDFYAVKESGANINRVIYHVENSDIALISAFRSDSSKKQNLENNKKLALDIHNIGLSYIKVTGSYKEENNSEFITEDSFIVIHRPESNEAQDEFFEEMLGLCRKYNQDAVLISLKNRKDVPIASYDSNGKIVYGPFTKLTLSNIEDFYTRIHNHKFKFESIVESEEGIKPSGYSNAMRYYGTKALLKLK